MGRGEFFTDYFDIRNAFNATGRKENLEKYLVLFSEKDDIPDLSDETE